MSRTEVIGQDWVVITKFQKWVMVFEENQLHHPEQENRKGEDRRTGFFWEIRGGLCSGESDYSVFIFL